MGDMMCEEEIENFKPKKANVRKSLFGNFIDDEDENNKVQQPSTSKPKQRRALGQISKPKPKLKLSDLEASLTGINQLSMQDDFEDDFNPVPEISSSRKESTSIKNRNSQKSIGFSPIITDKTEIISSKPPLANGTFVVTPKHKNN